LSPRRITSCPEAISTVTIAARMLNPETFLVCPLTKEIMEDPVLLVDSGHTFERSAIEKWIKEGNNCCPVTGKPLRLRMLVQNVRVKEGVSDLHNACKAVLESESLHLEPEMEKVANWIELLLTDLPINQHIALSALADSELTKEAKEYFAAMGGISALLRILYNTRSTDIKGSVVRVLWLNVLREESGRLEVVRQNGLSRICEVVCNNSIPSLYAESALRCLRVIAFTSPLRAQARSTGVLQRLVDILSSNEYPVSLRTATASALAVLLDGEELSREEVMNSGGIQATMDHLGHYQSGGDRILQTEALGVLRQLAHNAIARKRMMALGVVKELSRILQSTSHSLRLAAVKVCRLIAMDPENCPELAKGGIIPPLVQMILKAQGAVDAAALSAVALCNMAQEPMCRRLIVRTGIHLVRQKSDTGERIAEKPNKKRVQHEEIVPATEWHILLKDKLIQGDEPVVH